MQNSISKDTHSDAASPGGDVLPVVLVFRQSWLLGLTESAQLRFHSSITGLQAPKMPSRQHAAAINMSSLYSTALP